MIRGLKFFLFFAAVLYTLNVQAQDRFYHVYVDSDNDTLSGCDVNLPDFGTSINGAEGRLTITTDSSQPPVITSTNYHSCVGAGFDAGTTLSPAALGLNTSSSNHDVFEAQLPTSLLDTNTSGSMRFYFVSDSDTASDIVLIDSNGEPIVVGISFPPLSVPVPSLGLLALALLIFGFVLVARRNINRKLSVMLVLLATSSAAWAMAIMVDGQTGDWSGISPANTDPTNDTSVPGSFADLTQVFLTQQNTSLFFRMDVVDVENQAPVANDSSDSTLEETTVTITVTGSDAENEALTFAVSTPPANGTLSAFTVVNDTTSTVDYTPDTDFNGTDSFTFTANDGQVNSGDATVDVTVTGINDEPTFTSGGNVNQLKTAGPYSEIWATDISAGAANESAQNLTFTILSNDNNAIFSVQPSIDSTGVLSFTGIPDATGTANLTVNLTDDGGTANGGDDTSATVSFAITLQGVNDEPSFIAGGDQSVLEDAGAQTVAGWATAISAGPADESGQALTFIVTNNDDPTLFSVAPAVDATTGDLTFTPAADANGIANISVFLMDDGGTANGGDDTSPTASFNITVTAVNDAPSFTAGPNQSVLEGAGAQTVNNWATDISPGPADEVTQSVTFSVSNDNNNLFSVQPAIDSSGNLTFTPDPNELGTATVSVSISDNGGTANGGVDTSAVQTFDISVTLVNDEPSFTVGADQTANEDAGLVTVANWATNILAGPPDEAGQNLTFNITANDNAALFSAGPAVASDGTLTYTSAADANGVANITLELMDDGGTANGGDDTSPPQNFSITINAVNDAPLFTAGADQSVLEESGAQTVNGWATAISPGPADEATQSVSFDSTNNNNALFSVQPAIDNAGNLTYTPAANTSGVATVSVSAMDDGGTANGGVDTSATQNFTITVVGVNDAPSFTAAANPAATNEDGGAASLSWASAISAGPADESGQTLTFNLTQTSIDATLSFALAPSVNSTTGNVEYTTATNAFGSATYDVVLMDDGGTANGGVDTSSPAVSLTITVNPVNDPPSVTAPGPFPVTTNIRISVPDGANDLLAGATDVEAGTSLFIQGTGNITSTEGGTVAANTLNGAFTYDPPPGFTGADTFNYVVCDNGVPAPSACSTPATVTLNVSGNTIWFIDNSAAAGGDGTLQTPFDSLADFNASTDPGNGDYIYLASGTYSGAGLTLANNQTLFGQGRTGTFDTVAGITAAPFSIARPTLGGARPVITSSANGINLASGNDVRGLNVGNTTNFGFRGTVVGNLVVDEVSVTGNGGGLQVTSSGAFSLVSFDVLDSTTSTSSAIELNNVTGNMSVDNGGSGINNAAANSAIRIDGGTISLLYPNPVNNTVGRSVEITNKTGGLITLGGLVDDDASGVSLVNNTGATITFNNLDLDTGTDAAFRAIGGGTVNVTGTNSEIDTTTGRAVEIVNTTIGSGNVAFVSVSQSGGANAITLNNTGTTGNFAITSGGSNTVGSGGTITNLTGEAILLTDTMNPLFNGLDVSNITHEAIKGVRVNGIRVINGSFVNAGSTEPAADDDVFGFDRNAMGDNGLSGTALFQNLTISDVHERAIDVVNEGAGTLDLDIIAVNINDNDDAQGEDAIKVQSRGSINTDVNIFLGTYNNIELDVLAYFAEGTGTNTVTVSEVTSTNGGGPDNFPNGGGVAIIASNSASVLFDINDNDLTEVFGEPVQIVGLAGTNGTVNMSGVIDANGTSLNPNSSFNSDLIDLDFDGIAGGTSTIEGTITVSNNFMSFDDDGVGLDHRDAAGTINLTISDNTLTGIAGQDGDTLDIDDGVFIFTDDDETAGVNQLNVELSNNTINNVQATDNVVEVLDVQDANKVCLDLTGTQNTAGEIELDTVNSADLNVVQTSAANLSTLNNGITVDNQAPGATFGAAVCIP